MQGECDFKKFHKPETWRNYTAKGPKYGEPSGEHPIGRCPKCGRRFFLKARYYVGGEFVFFEIPKHKPRKMRKPGPRRQSQMVGRGK